MLMKFSFLPREQFFSRIVVIFFLAWRSVFLFHTYLDVSSNCICRFFCVLRPSKFLSGFLTLFRALISPFSNSDNLVPLNIYVFSILNITVLIAFMFDHLTVWKTNEWYLIELLKVQRNILIHLTVWKWINNIQRNY